MKLFLDANVMFAAAVTPQGRVQELFRLGQAGLCEFCTSAYALDEVNRNIMLKFPQAAPQLGNLLTGVRLVGEPEAALILWASSYLPDKDAPILAAAVAAQVDGLVTGDKAHFGRLYGQTLRSVKVVSPAEALALVLEL